MASGFRALVAGRPDMNTLVGLGASASFGVSCVAAALPALGWKTFFEEPAMLLGEGWGGGEGGGGGAGRAGWVGGWGWVVGGGRVGRGGGWGKVKGTEGQQRTLCRSCPCCWVCE